MALAISDYLITSYRFLSGLFAGLGRVELLSGDACRQAADGYNSVGNQRILHFGRSMIRVCGKNPPVGTVFCRLRQPCCGSTLAGGHGRVIALIEGMLQFCRKSARRASGLRNRRRCDGVLRKKAGIARVLHKSGGLLLQPFHPQAMGLFLHRKPQVGSEVHKVSADTKGRRQVTPCSCCACPSASAGAVAACVVAIGAIAIGCLAIGRLALGKARVGTLEIGGVKAGG